VYAEGQPTPKLLPRSVVRTMRPGSMIVDIAIEEGGVAETSRPTTHEHPAYVEEGVIHYAVGNMPAADAPASTIALAAATLPYLLAIATRGLDRALAEDPGLAAGVVVKLAR